MPCALEAWRLDARTLDPAKAKYLLGFDREEARRLLTEAGFPKGFSTPMSHYPGYLAPWPSSYELAVDELGKIGIKIELRPPTPIRSRRCGANWGSISRCTSNTSPG